MTKQQLGQLLAAKRKESGISIYQIIKQTGLKFEQVKGIEAGSANYTIASLLLYLDAAKITLNIS